MKKGGRRVDWKIEKRREVVDNRKHWRRRRSVEDGREGEEGRVWVV